MPGTASRFRPRSQAVPGRESVTDDSVTMLRAKPSRFGLRIWIGGTFLLSIGYSGTGLPM